MLKTMASAAFLAAMTFACTSAMTSSRPLEGGPQKTVEKKDQEEASAVERACQPLTSYSCQSWPAQAQVIAKVAAVKSLHSEAQKACEVTLDVKKSHAHVLCPLDTDSPQVSYLVCGACPEKGSEIFGVILRDAKGVARLDP